MPKRERRRKGCVAPWDECVCARVWGLNREEKREERERGEKLAEKSGKEDEAGGGRSGRKEGRERKCSSYLSPFFFFFFCSLPCACLFVSSISLVASRTKYGHAGVQVLPTILLPPRSDV